MSKRSADVKQLRLLSLDELHERFQTISNYVNSLKQKGKQIPRDVLEKLTVLTAALKVKTHKFKRFHGKREEHGR